MNEFWNAKCWGGGPGSGGRQVWAPVIKDEGMDLMDVNNGADVCECLL
jgi:hypothetical protein